MAAFNRTGSGGGHKRTLSERLKGMRFMKQREEAATRERLLAEQEKREAEAHWSVESVANMKDNQKNDTKIMPIIVFEQGVCEENDDQQDGDVFLGRRSFGMFNPVLQRQNDAAIKRKEDPVESEMKDDEKVMVKVEEDSKESVKQSSFGLRTLLNVNGRIEKKRSKKTRKHKSERRIGK